MTHEQYTQAAEYWHRKDAESTAMPREQLLKSIRQYLETNNTCALATGVDGFVRCTPIEYSYRDGAIWMFSEGGEKFAALEKNNRVCLAVFDKYDGFGSLKGLQLSGICIVVEPFSEEYTAQTEAKKIPLAALRKLDHTMNLLKVIPEEIVFLNSDFKKAGFASRQIWHGENGTVLPAKS